jgi:hypothetical protein
LHQQKNFDYYSLPHENKTKGIERIKEIMNQDYINMKENLNRSQY